MDSIGKLDRSTEPGVFGVRPGISHVHLGYLGLHLGGIEHMEAGKPNQQLVPVPNLEVAQVNGWFSRLFLETAGEYICLFTQHVSELGSTESGPPISRSNLMLCSTFGPFAKNLLKPGVWLQHFAAKNCPPVRINIGEIRGRAPGTNRSPMKWCLSCEHLGVT